VKNCLAIQIVGLFVVLVALGAVAQAWTVAIDPADIAPGASVIDFETGSTGLPTSPDYSFSAIWPNGGTSAFGSEFFGAQHYGNTTIVPLYSQMRLTLAAPTEAIGAWVGQMPNFRDEHVSLLDVSIYDNSFVLLTTVTVPLPLLGEPPVFVGFASDQGIRRLLMTGNDTGFFGADNITFGEFNIPEPAGILCLALAALLISPWRRRRA